MTVVQTFLLGLLQGFAEFLPVSSSGHLVVAEHFLKIQEPTMFFNVFLHVATLLATILYFWRDVKALCIDSIGALTGVLRGHSWGQITQRWPQVPTVLMILLGTVMTAVIGLGGKDWFESLFARPRTVALMLVVTGCSLLLTRWIRPGRLVHQHILWYQALLIGVAQGLAVVPGISRSGATIACALFLGVAPKTAARFSFLLAIPAIAGAALLEGLQVPPATLHWMSLPLWVGFCVAAISGVWALRLLMPLVARGQLYRFSYYLIPAGFLAWWLMGA